MMHSTKPVPRRAAISAAMFAALLLAGCSSGHIGESWQCPLAKGGSCDSVAAADPAVPDMDSRTVLGEPLWRVHVRAPEMPSETVCTAGCGGVFDPFGRLVRLLGESDDGDEERSAAGQPDPATAAKVEILPAGPDREADAATSSTAREATEPRLAEPSAATLSAEPAAAEDDPRAEDLRTGEVVARIWIAPFVDADGVYREASHVRVVLEPAGWRLK